jgi:hypothetical protein
MPGLTVLTSGGHAPAMNQAVSTVVKVGTARSVDVIGVESGYAGLCEGRTRPPRSVDLDGWWHRGRAALDSARSTEVRTPEGRDRAAAGGAHAGPKAAPVRRAVRPVPFGMDPTHLADGERDGTASPRGWRAPGRPAGRSSRLVVVPCIRD